MAKVTDSNIPFEELDSNRPFLGLRSFEEKNKSQFGGRNQEIDDLYDLVGYNFLTVVYGDSGIGKTSLLKAGLMPKLRENFYFPVYIRIDFSAKKAPLRQLIDHVYSEMKELDPTISKMESESLWEYLHDLKLLNGLVTPVLIFDQFEELFTLGKGNKNLKEFVSELGDLAQNRIPSSVKLKYKEQGKTVPARYSKQNYHLVLSLREDYLARLDELKNHIPSIMNNGFRVVQMTISQALEAAIKPGKGLIDEPVAIQIIKKLPGVSQADFDLLNEKTSGTKALKVEPFLLSLICDRLNEVRIDKGGNKIDKTIVEEFNVHDVIKSFYNETLQKFKPNVELAIENLLLDDDGFRKLQPLKKFQSEYDISDDDIIKLVNSRIVRQESRNSVDYLELIHDVLKGVIKKKRDKREKIELHKAEKKEREVREKAEREEREVREAAEREERNKKEKEREARSKKKKRMILTAVAIVFMGVVGSYLYIGFNFKEKQNDIWEMAKIIPSAQGFEAYLKAYPNGSFKKEALKRIDKFYWGQAISDSTDGSLNKFKKYLSVSNILKEDYDYTTENEQIVTRKIDSITSENKREFILDEDAWNIANEKPNDFDSYLGYIKDPRFKKKAHIKEAIAKINALGTVGWLFSGRFNQFGDVKDGNEKIYEVVSRKGGIILTKYVKPSTGDVIRCIKGGRSTYAIISKKTESRGVWSRGKEAYVAQVFKDGRALFLQIIYKK